jgi:hypothetical protein
VKRKDKEQLGKRNIEIGNLQKHFQKDVIDNRMSQNGLTSLEIMT